ncbi:hypothetical protein LIPSTDRAFT_329802 [Lipomyces starkeyi NRRL Y-11557]|uniref:DDE Tnp4 domain-containing protein n=1 Tax=Lipomyces starkeyi NRRL Y-11557 TaxID=675824 RepID=A0A1E3Q1Z5_LIPST|nr:hypothetical protein LIPSTDRAFT_329802 [Lipomyces starkeyi NRRL Y-11557]
MGSVEGKLGDWILWRMTGMEAKIRDVLQGLPEGHDGLFVYGDPAYAGGYGVMGPFKRHPGEQLTEAQSRFNVEMSRVRIWVEQIFGLALQRWASNGFKYSLRLESSPVPAFYMVAILLTNIKTCLDGGNVVPDAFGCDPPLLVDYLRIDEDEV